MAVGTCANKKFYTIITILRDNTTRIILNLLVRLIAFVFEGEYGFVLKGYM